MRYTMRDGSEVGLCLQHHPDTVTARKEEERARLAGEYKARRTREDHRRKTSELRKAVLKGALEAHKRGDLPQPLADTVAAWVAHEGDALEL